MVDAQLWNDVLSIDDSITSVLVSVFLPILKLSDVTVDEPEAGNLKSSTGIPWMFRLTFRFEFFKINK